MLYLIIRWGLLLLFSFYINERKNSDDVFNFPYLQISTFVLRLIFPLYEAGALRGNFCSEFNHSCKFFHSPILFTFVRLLSLLLFVVIVKIV